MVTTVVGTLSTRGWARTPEEKIRELINHFTESGYSQSVLYKGSIKSLSYLRAAYIEDPTALAEEVQKSLTTLLRNVFFEPDSVVEVEVTSEADRGSEVVYRLVITARVPVAGQKYDVYDSVEIKEQS